VFAELGQTAFAEIPQLPSDACLDAIRLARMLRAVERGGASLIVMGLIGMIAMSSTPRPFQNQIREALSARFGSSASADEEATAPETAGTAYRYPYSVIPGGVFSIEDLRAKIINDPVAAAHYADFDFRHARVVKLERNGAFYVSYRMASGIFWTTERISVRRGELLLTDGASFVLARSGNRLSEVPLLPASSLEPTAAEMDAAEPSSISGE
jgi:hypothetical protein